MVACFLIYKICKHNYIQQEFHLCVCICKSVSCRQKLLRERVLVWFSVLAGYNNNFLMTIKFTMYRVNSLLQVIPLS